jgi:hypothetical protein
MVALEVRHLLKRLQIGLSWVAVVGQALRTTMIRPLLEMVRGEPVVGWFSSGRDPSAVRVPFQSTATVVIRPEKMARVAVVQVEASLLQLPTVQG